MNWQVRHEGSPETIVLTREELQEQLVDGIWEATDEVMGPGEESWVALENHPEFADLAAELEPPPARPYDDETRLDMNALIDVTLVLLVFFILTTTVAALQKQIEAPTIEAGKAGVAVFTKEQVATQMIHVKLTSENDELVVRIEDKVVDMNRVTLELQRFVRNTSKNILLVEHDNKVTHDAVVQLIDAAKVAGMDRVRFLVP